MHLRHPLGRRTQERQRGSISPLMIGFCLVLLMLALGTYGVSKAFLYQRDLANAADGAALYAADAIDTGAIYAGGQRRLSPARVQAAVAQYLANQPHTIHVSGYDSSVTGADRLTARVTLHASMPVPFVDQLFSSASIPISATASARGLG